MDIIEPPLVWIERRCYRTNAELKPAQGVDVSLAIETQKHNKDYENYDVYDQDVDEISNSNLQIAKTEDGRFCTKMTVASEYFPRIIGRNGDVKRQIEKETKTQVSIPKKGQTGNIIITGLDCKGVGSAYCQISLIVSSARKRMPFTHFISIPLTSPGFKTKFLEFKADVLSIPRSGLTEELFQNPDKLHLTIATLVLLTNDERNRASSALENLVHRAREIIGSEPLAVEIRGVECMNDDPEQVDVLYGRCVDESGRLQAIADLIVSELESKDLLDRQYSKVKLHVTYMNSLFQVKDDFAEDSKRVPFNAKDIIQKWKTHSFGWQSIDSIHLSQRYSTSSTGYYVSSAEISLK